jgi:hypothetical protein
VDGASFARVAYAAPSGAAFSTFFDSGGLTLQASCVAGELAIRATSTVPNTQFHWGVNQIDNPLDDDDDDDNNPAEGNSESDFSLYGEADDLDPGEFNLVADGGSTTSNAPDSSQGTMSYRRPDGVTVTAIFSAEVQTNGLSSQNDCFVNGTATIL